MASFSETFASAFKAFIPNPPREATVGGYESPISVGESAARFLVDGLTAGALYETQPHLRTVVSFVSRNIAQLGRHVYTRGADGGRTRQRTSAAAKLAQTPNEYMTGYELFDNLVHEISLHDYAIWVPRLKDDGDWAIDPIPGDWLVKTVRSDAFRVGKYVVQFPGNPRTTEFSDSEVVVFRGYHPAGPSKLGSSPVRALRGTLSEQLSALEFREQMWKRGGRVGAFLTRPATAPAWSTEARDAFIQQWRASWSGSGSNAGATPLLEDGLELKRIGFAAKEEQWLEAATLALTTVAGAYHVPPVMVGANTGSTFSSTREFRKMLYTETLGPTIAMIEEVWNTFLMPFIGASPNEYLELNIHEKLQGDFVEQGALMQSAAGGPFMTRNEVRGLMNLSRLEGNGEDELIVPLNVLVGGQASPTDSGSQNDQGLDSEGTTSGAASAPSRALKHEAPHLHKAPKGLSALEDDLAEFFARQRRATLARIDQKEPGWWDQKKWNAELSSTLLPHLLKLSAGTARQVAGAKKLNPDDYSVARTEKFLKAVADSRADLVNATTRDHYSNAIENGTDVEEVLSDTESRSKTVGGTIATFVVAFATAEVATQLAPKGSEPTKTWLASGLANSRHADMDGETVKLDENFSNGMAYPGDPTGGAENVANCGCGVDVSW